jgi:hypothetical protein
MISSYLTEEDLFSASQVCQYWRSALISSPSLWTRISCHCAPRTITSLERCGPLSIQLRIEPPFSNVALEDVLLRENNIVSLTIQHQPNKPIPLHQLLTSSGPHLERLHIYTQNLWERRAPEQTMHEVWRGLPFLRELFVCRYSLPIHQLVVPNLVHLALEHIGYKQNVTVQTILDLLCRCPLLETLLISHSDILPPATARNLSPVRLPHLRSIEVGVHEVRSGLIVNLDFPKNIAAGFRALRMPDVWGNITPAVTAAIQHVLGEINIYHITLAIAPNPQGNVELLLRFEGPHASLEINVRGIHPAKFPDLFGPQGVIFSLRPRTEEVRELHIINCCLEDSQELHLLNVAMPNVVSISFFNCSGPHMSELLAPAHPLSPPFPHLERLMVLGPESGLEEIVRRRRRDLDMRLKTLIIGRRPGAFEYNPLEDHTILEGLVGDLWVGCPTQILEWRAGNEIANFWSTVMVPGQVCLRKNLIT